MLWESRILGAALEPLNRHQPRHAVDAEVIMAYKHDVEAKPVHSMQPSHLIEAIVRERIFHSAYWKEQCFGINGMLVLSARFCKISYSNAF